VYIVNYIRAQKLRWFGLVHQMANDKMVKKLCEWKLIRTRLAGRPKVGWKNDIKDLRIIKINNWTKCIQDQLNGRK